MSSEHRTSTWNPPKTLAEMQAEAAASADGGMGIRCPKCNCGHWRVWYTRDGYGTVKRKRICRHCGYKVNTQEKIVGQPLPPTAEPNISEVPQDPTQQF